MQDIDHSIYVNLPWELFLEAALPCCFHSLLPINILVSLNQAWGWQVLEKESRPLQRTIGAHIPRQNQFFLPAPLLEKALQPYEVIGVLKILIKTYMFLQISRRP